MEILNRQQIEKKLNRLAVQIIEENFDAKSIVLAGINNNGLRLARLLEKRMRKVRDIDLGLIQIRLNPAAPLSAEIDLSVDAGDLKDKHVIIVDDVANTGRTIFFAFKPFLEIVPRKIEVCVLVDRTHKSFPVKVDYVGMDLATTTEDNIHVQLTPWTSAYVGLE